MPTAAIAARIATERGIDAPIIAAVAAILDGAITIRQAVTALMTRPLKTETDYDLERPELEKCCLR